MKHNWEYKRLGDVCKIVNGFAFKSELFKDSGMPILRIANIQNDTITTDALAFCNPSDYKTDLSKFLVKSDDLVMALSGATTGKIGINKTNIEFYLNQRVALFKDILISRRYLFYFLKTEGKNILESAFGVAQPNVSTSKLIELYIPVPPMEVQERIVAELDKINETIEDCRELLCNLDALAQSLFYDTFGDPITNPNNFTTSKLDQLCNIIGRIGFRGYTRNDLVEAGQGAITLSPTNIVNGVVSFEKNTYISWDKYEESPEIKICEGDVLLTKTGSTVGKVGIVLELPEKATINPQLVVLKNLKVNNWYITYLLRDSAYQEIIREKSGGSAVPTISQKILSTISIPVPPLALQEQFAARIEQIEEQKKAVEQTIAELQTLLDSRMDYWFN